VDNNPQLTGGRKTREIAAKAAGFDSSFSYRQATKVVDHGTPELTGKAGTGSQSRLSR